MTECVFHKKFSYVHDREEWRINTNQLNKSNNKKLPGKNNKPKEKSYIKSETIKSALHIFMK